MKDLEVGPANEKDVLALAALAEELCRERQTLRDV